MRILITGITGLFGSYLAREFCAIGEIHGLKRPSSSTKILEDIEEQITWHEGDINDYQSLQRAFKGMDLIIHAAGLVSFSKKDKNQLLKVNYEGTTNVVNVMLALGIKRLVHISSVAALGRTPDQQTVNENHKWVDSPWNTPYAISKYLGELEVWRGVQEGLEALVVNPAVLLARESETRSSAEIYRYVAEGNRFYPKGDINFIDIRDAASITYQLYRDNQWEERFILSKGSLSFQAFFTTMAETMDRQPPKIAVNNFMITLATTWGQIKQLFGLKPLLNKQTAMVAQLPITFDNQKVNKLTGYQYRSLKETFQWAVNKK
ncbi:NAD-dependent epimerase/dehydratase family protein [Echinicola soli]|uniref:NAD-dependent epimerase/dehydratase family protein n=1 Tax=Echinicola soli TaxID=2591634 RepID=A0A514CEV4_9BACT|nr:NAD-dependent epimerase/dehydratase family protein [Echinicola soli]QDH78353.1 NAD-dependent epimerase/dehydratase family protein [Echinicola soli]